MQTRSIRKRSVLGVLGLLLATYLTCYKSKNGGIDIERQELTDEVNRRSTQDDSVALLLPQKSNLKVYIYQLPERLNLDITKCDLDLCVKVDNRGFGHHLYDDGEMKLFRTNHFSLEVMLHNQLLHSKYRTDNPDEADVFYIPAYLGTQFFCNFTKIGAMVDDTFREINKLPYFRQGMPHISTLAKIEREQATARNPVLRNPLSKKVIFFTIEKETLTSTRQALGLADQRVIVAPYPSYGHLDPKVSLAQSIQSPGLESRPVFMFLAAGNRRSNYFRNKIVDQMATKINDTSFSGAGKYGDKVLESIWLLTSECKLVHENITIDWMKHSVFCLQPHGDSPTRKSFYDSIVSGCIPVIFRFSHENVEYPFQRVLNYSDFVVSIDGARVENGERILTILRGISNQEIQRLHNNVLKVARMLQYSYYVYIDDSMDHSESPFVDALDMLMHEVKHNYNL